MDLLYDCLACQPYMEGNLCRGVITESKGGREYYTCSQLIDTTGDADILRRGGVPTVAGQNFFTYIGKTVTLEGCRRALVKNDISHVYGGVCGGGINLFGDNQPADVPKWSGLTVEEVTDYLVTNQQKMLDSIKGDARLGRDIAMLPLMPQFRTTCHIEGDYTFTVEDAYRHFADSVGAICDFEHRDHLFEVPYRTLYNRRYPNILTAGRSACGEGYGWDLLRVIPVAVQTGQAAGEAACQAILQGVAVADVNISVLQGALEKDGGIMIHFPDEYIPEDRTVIIHGKNAVDVGHL